MDVIAETIKGIAAITAEHGVFQTVVLVLIVAFVLRDWFIRKQNTGILDALVNNNESMTKLFSTQVAVSQMAATASSQSAIELAKQTAKLETLCEQKDQLIDLTKASNEAITKLADSFGSDPLKLCKQTACGIEDEHIVAKFAAEWKQPAEKVRAALERVKRLDAEREDKPMLAH